MSVYIGGISRDSNRVFNKILGTFNSSSGGTVRNEKMPLPIDLTLNVSILTRYQADMDQILSHLIPYINPYFAVSWRTPGRPDHEIRSSVFWNGVADLTYPYDINSSVVARVAADLSFVFKGWMFQSLSDKDIGTIHDIQTYYSPTFQGIPKEYLLDGDESTISSPDFDFHLIKGVPPQPKIIEPYYMKAGTSQSFRVYGSGFTVLNNVYLSGTPIDNISTFYSPFSAIPTLSANNPTFKAYKLKYTDWAYDKDSFLTFVAPVSVNTPGLLDLIVEGPAGYGTLTQFVRYNNFNPFLSSDEPEYSTYIPYQLPYLSGIEVRMP
jgi:hypothetical protein